MTLPRPCARVVIAWGVVLLVALASGVGLALLARRMAPVKPGSPELFWRFACGVKLDDSKREDFWNGEVYFIDDKWVAYDSPHLHGSEIYYVNVKDVKARFEAVVAALETARSEGKETVFVKGYVQWLEMEKPRRTPENLVECIKKERSEVRMTKDVNLLVYQLYKDMEFGRRWQRARAYWANFVFEWLFLTGLALFAMWPAIRGATAVRYAIHAGLLPFLFLLPAYLGYATLTFTSRGPSGGVLYPWLLLFARPLDVFSSDRWMVGRMPQLLEPLSAPAGIPVATTGMPMPGPVSALIVGAILAVAVFLGSLLWRDWKRGRIRLFRAQGS